MPAKKIDKDEMKLEDAMRRLDEVVKLLEAEGADLDESLKLYEEGVRLVRICNERLADADRKVKRLKLSPDGEIVEEELDRAENE